MKKIAKSIIIIATGILAIAATSCKKDDTIRYNNATMGNVVNGIFTSDQGNIFNVVEQTCPGKLDTMKRAFVICDVLSEKAGTENEYEVRLNYISSVLTKDAIFTSSLTKEMVNDPIVLQSYWVSGGYLNIYFAIPVVSDSKVVHYINFEYEDNASEAEGTYTITVEAVDTAIHGVEAEVENDVIYDLTGRRIAEITKGGIYIVNGKKVLVK